MTPEAGALRDILAASRTIAVVGLSPNPARPSHGVARYLQSVGYRIIPVNPHHAAILGERSYDTLTAAAQEHRIDIVDVFRRSAVVGPIVDEAIRLPVPPKLIWLQIGVVDEAAQQRARAAGIPFVMDHCLMAEHRAVAA
ncbi:MAG TPA: CoA-binding protein [Gemmatimonadales bacterium]|nr:CoA-binding protein [Gemmatimonadales bacterium]